jgi:hypothetical protein
MILRIDKAYTYCDYNEEEPFFHDLLIDISNGKVSTDLNINGMTHNFTEFFLETSKGKTDVRISSLDFLDNNELEYIQEVCNYKEKEEFYKEDDYIED